MGRPTHLAAKRELIITRSDKVPAKAAALGFIARKTQRAVPYSVYQGGIARLEQDILTSTRVPVVPTIASIRRCQLMTVPHAMLVNIVQQLV